MDKLIDLGLGIFSTLGSPAHQIAENLKFIKGVIKLVLGVIKNLLT
jgi:hypothetical protein